MGADRGRAELDNRGICTSVRLLHRWPRDRVKQPALRDRSDGQTSERPGSRYLSFGPPQSPPHYHRHVNARQRVPGLHVSQSGAGQPVLFVHGGLMDGSTAWTAQKSLSNAYRLRFIDRFGYGHSDDRPDDDRLQADVDAVAALLEGGSHLVGHSYGGLICLLACACSPTYVLSLTLIEPPAF